ncbi:AIR synthase family protein [Limnochorda pilosa]|uniref:AIR synthase n=1 Tax=Limnochorda pilosa TaxID=1555112 RepID=A0A0K2SJV7_LIMPI|nr:AIR synthase family protein [Limnochorda pilosa]BAS27292.1 AIR synthase [Limnochorda pilosa]
MQAGKLSTAELRRRVLTHLGHRRPEVRVRAGVGLDSAVIDLGGDLCVVSSDPITGAGEGAGRLAVVVSCNDVAAMGAVPVGVQVTLLLPEGAGPEDVERFMEEVSGACEALGIEVLGGHTEITSRVTAPVLVTTAVGRVPPERLVQASGARAGDGLVVTKGVGLEGTAILATDFAQDLEPRVGAEVLARARRFTEELSVVAEALAAARLGATAMHDVTEGGLYGACREMALASGLGVELWTDHLPVRPETRAICEVLGMDPAGLISSGTLLIAAPDPEAMAGGLKEEGFQAFPVGRLVPSGFWRLERKPFPGPGAGRRPFPEDEEDELWRFLRTR